MRINTALMSKQELEVLEAFLSQKRVPLIEEEDLITSRRFDKLPRSRKKDVFENTKKVAQEHLYRQLRTIDMTMKDHEVVRHIEKITYEGDMKTHTLNKTKYFAKDGWLRRVVMPDKFEIDMLTLSQSLGLKYEEGKGVRK